MLQKKLIIDSETKIDLINTTKITHITIDTCSSYIHFADNSKYSCNKSLIYFETTLPDTFIRVNRNSIINIEYIENINKIARKITIEKGVVLCISCRQMKNLIKRLNLISLRSTHNT